MWALTDAKQKQQKASTRNRIFQNSVVILFWKIRFSHSHVCFKPNHKLIITITSTMPVKQVWLNLPVKDILKSKVFFNQMGFFTEGERGNSEFSCPVVIGENKFTVMLFTEEKFHSFSKNPLCNTGESTEVLISLDAESREEVDEYARKATAAGG